MNLYQVDLYEHFGFILLADRNVENADNVYWLSDDI